MTDFRIYEMSQRENALFYGVSGAVALLVALLFYRNILFGAVIVPFLPRLKKFAVDYLFIQQLFQLNGKIVKLISLTHQVI